MFSALSQIWAALSALFSAVERSALALDHLARSGEEAARDYANDAAAERAAHRITPE